MNQEDSATPALADPHSRPAAPSEHVLTGYGPTDDHPASSTSSRCSLLTAPSGAVDLIQRPVVLTDMEWDAIEPLLLSQRGRPGRRYRDTRRIVEGMVYRYRIGIPWRDVPTHFGPWQTVWKRYHRYVIDGVWPQIVAALERVGTESPPMPVDIPVQRGPH